MQYSTDDMAKAGRTTLRAVRFWEAHNLLGNVPRNDQGHRVFSQAHMLKAELIAAAQICGMSIREIRDMLREFDEGQQMALWNKLRDTRIFLGSVEDRVFAMPAGGFDL